MIIQKLSMEPHQQDLKNKQGFITLILVSVISAIGLFFALSIFASSGIFLKAVSSLESGNKARALAVACSEDALQAIRENVNISGTYNLSFSSGTCSYMITNSGPTNISIIATGIVDSHTKIVNISIDQTTPQIRIFSWQEGL